MTRPQTFTNTILKWYQHNGRKDLPWRKNITPYRVWISEVMLQQTQVTTVIPYYQRFMQSFPTITALAKAPLDQVLAHWAGLGYYSRARNLHKTAQIIVSKWKGKFPVNFDEIVNLPGIGRSTAGAILSIAMQTSTPILDGNVKRVLCRFHAIAKWPGKTEITNQLWELATQHTPKQRADDYAQAIMDFGATLCTRTKPRCDICPVQKHCAAFKENKMHIYPVARPSKTIPTKTTQAILLYNKDNQILLQQRPPTGIWGGLWSLPECPTEEDAVDWFAKYYQLEIHHVAELPVLRHSFSHYHLHIYPVVAKLRGMKGVMESPGQIWYSSEQLTAVGCPAPIKKLLAKVKFT